MYCWYNDAGKERVKVIGDASMSDEEGWIAIANLKLNERIGQPDPKNATFGQVLDLWLKNGKSKTGDPKAPSTKTSDECHAKHLDVWANHVAKDMQPLAIQQWLDGKSYGIRSKIRSLMSGVFRYGQKVGLIPRNAESNPMPFVSAPATSSFEAVNLTPTECAAILGEISDPLVRILVVLVAVTGMRISEALGLRWSDLDFRKALIRIRRSWTGGKIGPPKSKQSRRPVVMTQSLAAVLEAWRRESKFSASEDFVFASSRKKGKQPRTGGILVTDHIRSAAIRADVLTVRDGRCYFDGELCQRFGAHNMRHGIATWLAEQGTDLQVIQRMLGHSTTDMSLHYVHIASQAREAQERFIQELVPAQDSTASGALRREKWALRDHIAGPLACHVVTSHLQ